MYFTYIVRCSDGSFYTGIAKDVDRRVLVHNSGKGAKYTKSRRPVLLVYSESFATKSDALRREIEIKKFSRPAKERLILSSDQTQPERRPR